MSSTACGRVFRVGASGHPVETLDGKLRLGRQSTRALLEIEFGGAAIVERLMWTLRIVEIEIATKTVTCVPRTPIIGEIDLLDSLNANDKTAGAALPG